MSSDLRHSENGITQCKIGQLNRSYKLVLEASLAPGNFVKFGNVFYDYFGLLFDLNHLDNWKTQCKIGQTNRLYKLVLEASQAPGKFVKFGNVF